MKNYKEMADSALKRISEYEAEQKRRKKIIKQTAIAVGSICVVLLVAVGLFKENLTNAGLVTDSTKNTTENADNGMSSTEKTTKDTKDKTHKKTTKKTKNERTEKQSTVKNEATENPEVTLPTTMSSGEPTFIMVENTGKGIGIIYADYDLKGTFNSVKPIEKGSIGLTQELRNAINDNGDERTYAVMVNFKYSLPDNYMDEIIIDGVSSSELKKQADVLMSEGKDEDAKRLYVKINDAKRAYLRGYIDTFEETFNKNGMEIYVEERGTTVDDMIFYTFATGDKINNFTCKESEAFCLTLAMRFK